MADDVDWYDAVEDDLNRVSANLEGIVEYPDETTADEAIETIDALILDLTAVRRVIKTVKDGS